jgi:hypothetical protein
MCLLLAFACAICLQTWVSETPNPTTTFTHFGLVSLFLGPLSFLALFLSFHFMGYHKFSSFLLS